jgi:hypothetical protein
MPAQLPTAQTTPVGLLPVDARLPDDLKRLLDAVDDDADLFTRDPCGWRLGCPRPASEIATPADSCPQGWSRSRSRDRGRDQRVRSRQSRPGHPRHPGRDVSVPRGTDPREIGTFNWQTYDVWGHLDRRRKCQ